MTERMLYLLRGIKQYIGIKTSRIYELVYKLHNTKPANTLTKTPNAKKEEEGNFLCKNKKKILKDLKMTGIYLFLSKIICNAVDSTWSFCHIRKSVRNMLF